jgi:hypothetical protein
LVVVGPLGLASIAADWWWSGTAAETVVRFAYLGFVTVWLALRCRAGYLRRRPHWTGESWRRYGRLAAWPVLAVVLVLGLSTEWGMDLTRDARASVRGVLAGVLTFCLVLGATGVVVAQEWMLRGEASAPFTRRRWCEGRRSRAGVALGARHE